MTASERIREARMNPNQNEFKRELERFIITVSEMPRFAGQTQVIRALRRIAKMAALN